MNTDQTYYAGLITKYLAGEADEKEIRTISEWIREDPAHASLFDEYRQTWDKLVAGRIDGIDLDREWLRIQPGLQTERIKQVEPPELGAVRSLLRQVSTRYSYRFLMQAAAVIILLAFPAFLLYSYLTRPEWKETSALNDNLEIVLPDGSGVTLNRNSTLGYPSSFKGDERSVTIDGEAYFTVAHDPRKPFVISSGEARIEVLGTSFNVNTRKPSGEIEVTLVDGSLQIYFTNQREEPKLLTPGEKAELNPAGRTISVSRTGDPNFMAWKTRLLIFTDERLDNIVATLNNVYASSVRIDNDAIARCTLTATFDHQTLESVLKVIAATLDLNIQSSSTGIVLSGKGCKSDL